MAFIFFPFLIDQVENTVACVFDFRVKNFHETQKGIYRGFYLTFLVSTLFNNKDRNNALRPYAIYLIFNCLIEIR